MATFTARVPVANADSVEAMTTQAISTAQTRVPAAAGASNEVLYPWPGPSRPVVMRGKSGGADVYWNSLNGLADPTGVFYRQSSPAFSTVTDIVIFSQ